MGVDYSDDNNEKDTKNQKKNEFIIKVELKKLRDLEIPSEVINYMRIDDHPNFAKLIGWNFVGNSHYFLALSKEENDSVPLSPSHLFPFTIGILNVLFYYFYFILFYLF